MRSRPLARSLLDQGRHRPRPIPRHRTLASVLAPPSMQQVEASPAQQGDRLSSQVVIEGDNLARVAVAQPALGLRRAREQSRDRVRCGRACAARVGERGVVGVNVSVVDKQDMR